MKNHFTALYLQNMHYTKLISLQDKADPKKNRKKKVTKINTKFEQTLSKLLIDTLSKHAINGSPNKHLYLYD